jgi:hypothetical protein
VKSDVNALVTGADGLTCRVCGVPDPPADETCDGMDHVVGSQHGCRHCGRLPQACVLRPCFGSLHETATTARLVLLSRLARRLVTRPAAGRADR